MNSTWLLDPEEEGDGEMLLLRHKQDLSNHEEEGLLPSIDLASAIPIPIALDD
jgi:hypothetical protein